MWADSMVRTRLHSELPNGCRPASPWIRLQSAGVFFSQLLLFALITGCGARIPFEGDMGEVFAVAFSPGWDVLASGSADGRVMLWNPRTGKRSAVLSGHKGAVYCVAFSSDG